MSHELVTVAASYTALKQLGLEYHGQCPACRSAASRFTVRPDRNLCECDICGLKCDASGLVQAMEGVSPERAAELLRLRSWTPSAPVTQAVEPQPKRPAKKPPRKKRRTQICGARNRRGLPCQCKMLYRGGKCRFHGGLSTGAKTPEGKAKAIAAMRTGFARYVARRRAEKS